MLVSVGDLGIFAKTIQTTPRIDLTPTGLLMEGQRSFCGRKHDRLTLNRKTVGAGVGTHGLRRAHAPNHCDQ